MEYPHIVSAGFYIWWLLLNGFLYFAEFHFLCRFSGSREKKYTVCYVLLSSLITSLGDVYNSAGEHERSYRMYENAITFDSSNSMACNNYAYFLSINGGDLEKALGLSEKAISGADADNPTYLDTYAWINYLMGNYEKAEEVQRKAMEQGENGGYLSAELYDHLGDILVKTGKKEEALEAWRKAVKMQEEAEETGEESYAATIAKIKKGEQGEF